MTQLPAQTHVLTVWKTVTLNYPYQIVFPYSQRRAEGYALFMVCQLNTNLEQYCIKESNFTNYFCVQSVSLP